MAKKLKNLQPMDFETKREQWMVMGIGITQLKINRCSSLRGGKADEAIQCLRHASESWHPE